MNHCGNTRREALNSRPSVQDVLCHHDYIERVIYRFLNQIKSKYYGGSRSMYIEGVALEHFSNTGQETS